MYAVPRQRSAPKGSWSQSCTSTKVLRPAAVSAPSRGPIECRGAHGSSPSGTWSNSSSFQQGLLLPRFTEVHARAVPSDTLTYGSEGPEGPSAPASTAAPTSTRACPSGCTGPRGGSSSVRAAPARCRGCAAAPSCWFRPAEEPVARFACGDHDRRLSSTNAILPFPTSPPMSFDHQPVRGFSDERLRWLNHPAEWPETASPEQEGHGGSAEVSADGATLLLTSVRPSRALLAPLAPASHRASPQATVQEGLLACAPRHRAAALRVTDASPQDAPSTPPPW